MGIIDATGTAGRDFPGLEDSRISAPAAEAVSVKVSVDRTFSFSEENVRVILADYLKRQHDVKVLPEQFHFKITDSARGGGFYESDFTPAKLDWIAVTVKDER